MRNTFSLAFYCRRSRADKKGLAPVELAISINSQRSFVNLPIKQNPVAFEKQLAAKKGNELKSYIATVEEKVRNLQMEYVVAGKQLTIDIIKEYIRSGFNTSYTIEDLWLDFFDTFRKKGTTPRNERKYELVIGYFYANVLPPSTQLVELNRTHIVLFERYLQTHFSNSTAGSMLSKLRTIILFGLNTEHIKTDPFKGIKIVRRNKDVEFLTMSEVNRIRSKQMPNDRLEHVKDLFLFQCFTALSYCDMAALTPEDYKRNQYGQTYIDKCRAKTKVRFCAILFEDAQTIAEKYNYRLPIVSNQRYNGYLKEIADLCGINKTLHTHLGRHTAGCYLLNKGLSIEVVAKIMGHTNTRMTRHYAHLLSDTVFDSVAALEGR